MIIIVRRPATAPHWPPILNLTAAKERNAPVGRGQTSNLKGGVVCTGLYIVQRPDSVAMTMPAASPISVSTVIAAT